MFDTSTPDYSLTAVVERNISAGRLSPTARNMSFGDTLRQYREANGLTWRVTFAELGLPVDYEGGMTDPRVHIIASTAFYRGCNVAGDDEFGVSVAWVDLDEWIDIEPGDYDALDIPRCLDDIDALSYWLRTAPGMYGHRYAVAFLDANGIRSVLGFKSRKRAVKLFRTWNAAYQAWLEECGDLED